MKSYRVFFIYFIIFQEPSTIYCDKNGKELDMKAIEAARQKQKDKKPEKGAKNVEKEEEIIKDEDIVEKKVQKKQLWLGNAIFVGVPVIRLI